jgi:prevent-host-death family protein
MVAEILRAATAPHLDMTHTIRDRMMGSTVVLSMGGARMKTMTASEFKAKCLQVIDAVSDSGEPVVVTKHGRAIVRLAPFRERPVTLFGALAGAIEVSGDIVSPTCVNRGATG